MDLACKYPQNILNLCCVLGGGRASIRVLYTVFVDLRLCARACVRACVRARARVCVYSEHEYSDKSYCEKNYKILLASPSPSIHSIIPKHSKPERSKQEGAVRSLILEAYTRE